MIWIKWEKGFINKPEVLQIARSINMTIHETASRLFLIWEWADGITETGHVEGLDADAIDAIAGAPGIALAMTRTRPTPWLILDPDGIIMPNFQRHNGATAKKRAVNASRQERYRDAHGITTAPRAPWNRNAASVT